jgi:hypothetical protein
VPIWASIPTGLAKGSLDDLGSDCLAITLLFEILEAGKPNTVAAYLRASDGLPLGSGGAFLHVALLGLPNKLVRSFMLGYR